MPRSFSNVSFIWYMRIERVVRNRVGRLIRMNARRAIRDLPPPVATWAIIEPCFTSRLTVSIW